MILGLTLPESLALLQIITFLGGIVWMYMAQKSDIREIRHDLQALEASQKSLNEAFSQLGKILTQVAVQDNRIGMLDRAVDELRHGKGFISNP